MYDTVPPGDCDPSENSLSYTGMSVGGGVDQKAKMGKSHESLGQVRRAGDICLENSQRSVRLPFANLFFSTLHNPNLS